MSSRFARGILAIVPALLLSGCAAKRDAGELFGPSEAGTLVLDAILTVGRPMPDLYLMEALDPSQPFVANAPDVISMEINQGEGSSRVTYQPVVEVRGRFKTNSTAIILPETRYYFQALLADGREVRATTVTPPAFDVTRWVLLEEDSETVRQTFRTYEQNGDFVYEQPENQVTYAEGLLEAQFTRPDVPAFQVSIESLDLDSELVIDPDFLSDEQIADLERTQSSPAIAGDEGTLRLPWLAIYYEGRYRLRAYAIDENWYDLIRTSPDFGGGGPGFGGSAGDSFERPLFRVEGGIGLFGSASVDSVGFYVHPRP
ncbi:MAG: hypothetical protein KC591_00505 [Gemmatimonadetes bacterium]|nr:hypothetical protein [Gemmatimonadota bacterium]